MRALVDCNNFFVSCERVFNPSLNGVPVIVMSGNDGCVIARSNEAKALGIPMGAPVFQWREVIERNNVRCYSCNHVLYGDMSRRIMTLLAEMVEDIEIFSVDEAFFTIPDDTGIDTLKQIAFRIQKCTGIPVSIGASRSRTLAKIASHIAKKEYLDTTHAFILNNRDEVRRRLAATPVGDVWGIGRRTRDKLLATNIETALQFSMMSRKWVKSKFTITGERTWLELHGVDCTMPSPVDAPRQSLSHSRTFATDVTDFTQLRQAIASFATTCAEKLRNEGIIAGKITVFIAGNIHHDTPQYSNSATADITYPTSSTLEIVKYADRLFAAIFRQGYGYKRAGVFLANLSPSTNRQMKLFNPIDEAKHNNLMKAVDTINTRIAYNSLHLAALSGADEWRPKSEFRSREFTTNFSQIMTINCKEK